MFSLNFTLAIVNSQPVKISYGNPLSTNTITSKTTDKVTNLIYNDTLYQASESILHLWPCHISQGKNGIMVYSDEGGTYNLTAIEPGVTPKQKWQKSFSSPIDYCWIADFDDDSYDDLAVKLAGGNLTVYNGTSGSEVNTFDIGSSVVASVDWDNDGGVEILLVSLPDTNGTHIFLNITFIDDVLSPTLYNRTYYLNQTDGFTFAVGGDWDLSSPGTEVVLMNATGGSIYVLQSADWNRSQTEMVNASVINLPGGKHFSNQFDFRSPFFAFCMSGSDIGIFYNNSIQWTTPKNDPYLKLINLGAGVKLLATYPQSVWMRNYTIYDALTGSIEYTGTGTLTASQTMSNNKNMLFAQWSFWGYSANYPIYQTEFSSLQPSVRETICPFDFYSSDLYIRDSVVHSSITVFGNPDQVGGVRFFTYLDDFNGDGKIDMLGLNTPEFEYAFKILELYTLEPTGLTSTREFFFSIFSISLYSNSADLRTLGLGSIILIVGIVLASIYYIRRRKAFRS